MVKKIVNSLLILAFVLSTAACSSQPTTNTGTPADSTHESNSQKNNVTTDTDSTNVTETVVASSLEELETIVLKDVEDSIASLAVKKDQLAAEIDSFEKYVGNEDKIKGFYDEICTETLHLEICLMEYSVIYAEFIMNSDKDFDDKYDDLDELYNVVYEDAGDVIYDEIYDGILDEMYDLFYDGILDEAYDSVPYEKWLDDCSDEYEMWLDACSECYEIWLDTRSDIYEFWLEMRSATFGKDAEEINEAIMDFKEDIEDLKDNLKK